MSISEEKVLDVLVYVYEEFLCSDEESSLERLQKKLIEAGFEDASIKHAISWLDDLSNASSDWQEGTTANPAGGISSFRVFSEMEEQHFTRDALGFLHLLCQNGLLDRLSREWVIERALALQPDTRLDVEQLQWVVLFVLYHYPGRERQFESFEGLFFSEDVQMMH
ncbi:MAG: DUF494 domain-containing protein [Gammaproteobacteria bacterium]|nr:MAG: DUF494 domain-containing protein [Gammaproteobacteria bacterium]